jgi:hypothetical protein
MTDDRFEDFVRRTAQGYHRPPQTPREAMWARIVAERAERKAEQARRPPARVLWVRWGLAAAAVLAVGIGIGLRMGPSLMQPSQVAMQPTPTTARGQIPAAFQIAALDHLRHVETFLTVFQSEARQGSVEQMPELARSLLENTRLLMDSPAGRDAYMAALLDDIEVVLAQIASYRGQNGSELTLIEQGIERRGLLLKLHAAVPAKYGAASAQGVL